MANQLDKIFESFDKNFIFKDKSALQINHQPKEIIYRDEQINQIASILAPILRGERPSNLFLYGKTGTGKTLSIKHVREHLLKRVKEDVGFQLRIEYLNCKLKKVSDTEYRILAELIRKMGGQVPTTGLPTESVYNKFIEIVDEKKQLVVLILDEIDYTVKKISDDFLYNLTRLNSELSKAQISIVGISNDLTFLESVDARVRSSLSEEEVIFPPYNAVQLKEILKKRAVCEDNAERLMRVLEDYLETGELAKFEKNWYSTEIVLKDFNVLDSETGGKISIPGKDVMPYFKRIYAGNKKIRNEIVNEFDLGEEEIEWLEK